MKCLTVSILVLLILSLGLIGMFTSIGNGASGISRPKKIDPNAVKAKIKEYEGLEKSLQDLAKKGQGVCDRCHGSSAQARRPQSMGDRDERTARERTSGRGEGMTRERMGGRGGSRIGSLVKAMHSQAGVELELIRKLAAEEGAKKTIAAIDGLLLNRQERLKDAAKKSQQQRRSAGSMDSQQRRTTGQRSTGGRRRR